MGNPRTRVLLLECHLVCSNPQKDRQGHCHYFKIKHFSVNCDSHPTNHLNLTSNMNLSIFLGLAMQTLQSKKGLPPFTRCLFVLNMLFGHREEERGLAERGYSSKSRSLILVYGTQLSLLFIQGHCN